MNKDFKTLYKRTKTDAVQICNISVIGDQFNVEFGQLDGKLQNKTTTCFPKNVGRANETTANGQALFEADAKWKSKIKSGYSEDVNCTSEVLLPMKVKMYQDQKKNVIFPCYASPKLNGVNGEFKIDENNVMTLYSRGGNEYPMLAHLETEIRSYLESINETSVNVELYHHGWYLEDITAAVKKFKALSHGYPTEAIEAHVFDIPSCDLAYRQRKDIMPKGYLEDGNIAIVDVIVLNSHTEIEAYQTLCVNKGYEGIIIRNEDGTYEYNQRSSDVFKFKIALDAEFKVYDFALDKNGHTVFNCYSNTNEDVNESFKVKLKGTAKQRTEMAAIASEYIGLWLKVEYETISKYGNPLKPVGIIFRDCDTDGNPIE